MIHELFVMTSRVVVVVVVAGVESVTWRSIDNSN